MGKKGIAMTKSTKKACSVAQRRHIQAVNARRQGTDIQADKENQPPLAASSSAPINYKNRICNLAQKCSRKDEIISTSKGHINTLTQAVKEAQSQLAEVQILNQNIQQSFNKCQESVQVLLKQKHMLEMKVSRSSDQLAHAVVKAQEESLTFMLKEKGIYKDEVRDMVTVMVHNGVAMNNVDTMVKTVAETLGKKVVGKIDPCSCGCFIKEAGEASKIYIVEGIQNGRGIG